MSPPGRGAGGIGMRSFSRSLPMALMRAREAAMRAFRPILDTYDLTEQQWRVLRALAAEGGGLEVGSLASRTFLLGPSLSRILAKLERRDLVTRTRVAGDARRALIELTPSGLGLVRRIGPASERSYERIEERFGADRLAELLDLLDDLVALAPAFAPDSDIDHRKEQVS